MSSSTETSMELKPLGYLDNNFRGYGKMYLSSNGFYLYDQSGGAACFEWIKDNFEAKESDIYVVSYPKTGTTWMQEIVYLIATDLDFEKAKSKNLYEPFPHLELSMAIENAWVNGLPLPRFIKSHYPYSLLPQSIKDKKCKMIYTVRNPKDAIVSLYHFMKVNPMLEYNGTFETVFNLFISERVLPFSPFWKHVLEFWEQRYQENILIVQYEDMQKDVCMEIRRVAEFLGKTLTDDQIQKVKDYTSFNSMKNNSCTNYKQFCVKGDFIRKGTVGDWKNFFTNDMDNQMNEYVAKHFKTSDLKFTYFLQ